MTIASQCVWVHRPHRCATGLDELAAIEPIHVGAWVKSMAGKFEKPTIKQHLAAIRMLFDYLVVGQILAINPAHAVRGPKHSVKRGKTPMLSAAQACQLLDSIDVSTVVGLRDRALIALMTFSFARGRHARRGLLRRRQALAAPPQRKRRQGP
jgi:site-specific recombinase XerC